MAEPLPPCPPLEQVLHSLLGEATLDSTGVFQLDAREALRKLRQFQIAGTGGYSLPLLACAHYLKTESIQFEPFPDRIHIHFRGGRIPTREELCQLFQYAFSRQELAYRHLALGIVSSLDGVTQVAIQSGPYRGEIQLEGITWGPQRPPIEGWRLELWRSGWKARLGLNPPTSPKPESLLNRLQHSPLELVWGNQRLKPPPFPCAPVQELYESQQFPAPQGWRTDHYYVSPGDFTARINLGGEKVGLDWLVDGLTFNDDPAQLAFPGFYVAIQAPLQLDASYQAVVRNETYRLILEEIRARLENIIARHVRPNWEERLWMDIFRALGVRWKVQQRADLLAQLQRRVLHFCEDPRAWGSGYHPLFAYTCRDLLEQPELPQETHLRAATFLLRAVGSGALEPGPWTESETWIGLVAGHDPQKIRYWRMHFAMRMNAQSQLPTDQEVWYSFLPHLDEDLPLPHKQADEQLAELFAWQRLSTNLKDWIPFLERAWIQVPPTYPELSRSLDILRALAFESFNLERKQQKGPGNPSRPAP